MESLHYPRVTHHFQQIDTEARRQICKKINKKKEEPCVLIEFSHSFALCGDQNCAVIANSIELRTKHCFIDRHNTEACWREWVVRDFALLSVIWSPFWPALPAAPGRPEVPAVPQTVQIQSWTQLPHNGRTRDQGTSRANISLSSVVFVFNCGPCWLLSFDRPLPSNTSLSGLDQLSLCFTYCHTDPVTGLVKPKGTVHYGTPDLQEVKRLVFLILSINISHILQRGSAVTEPLKVLNPYRSFIWQKAVLSVPIKLYSILVLRISCIASV